MNENLVLINGEIMPEQEAFIEVNDRGHNFGDWSRVDLFVYIFFKKFTNFNIWINCFVLNLFKLLYLIA